MSQTTPNKLLIWSLGALSSVATVLAGVWKAQITDLKTGRDTERKYYQDQIDRRDKVIVIERNKKDSLQGVILNRSDQSYDELKALLNIDSRKNTIIIKPKK